MIDQLPMNYTHTPLTGLGTALITTFKADGSVDYDALARLLDTQLTGFVDFLVVLGTTGEAATLTADEKKEVRRFIVNYVHTHPVPSLKGRSGGVLPLVLGVGSNNTAAVCAELDAMQGELIENYAAILSVCPYYNKPNQEGLYQHFCKVAEASPIPVILYNVPGRTGVNMLPETVMRIYNTHPDKIAGIKEASGNVEQIKHLIQLSNTPTPSPLRGEGLCPIERPMDGRRTNPERGYTPSLLVFSGDDALACPLMEAGAAGLISVASNAFPEDFWHIVHDKDAALQDRYAEMIRLLFAEGNPVGIKAVLAQKGIIGNNLRLPLVPASEQLQKKIQEELQQRIV